ncbi:hypothetical protein R4B61_01885 [Fructilactobacillus vespulae]|uniref:hypothetical protein n=1 Tax=Fructilactobacillus vespulae TaxID=1249630 RepID=UPI0039B4112B
MPNNCLSIRFLFFLIGLFLVSLGNSLSIISLAGNGLWTAASIQISQLGDFSIKAVLIFIGIAAIILNTILTKFNWIKILGELVFVFFFGNLINFFIDKFQIITQFTNTYPARITLAIIGIIIVCIGTSFYQRANLWMYPTDHLTAIVYHRFFPKNIKKAQLVVFMIPIAIILITALPLKSMQGIQVGTVFSLLMNGKIIQLSNNYLFPVLKDNR